MTPLDDKRLKVVEEKLFETPCEEHDVMVKIAETKGKGVDYNSPLPILGERSSQVAIDLVQPDVSIDPGVKDFGSSPEDLSVPVRPFKVKPLNSYVIPRKKFHDPPPKGRVIDVDSIIYGIQEMSVAAEKLQRTYSKEKDLKREDEIKRRRFQKDRLGARITSSFEAPTVKLRKTPTVRKATKVRKGSRHQNSLLSDAVVPQMFSAMTGNWNVRHDLGTSATLAVQEVTKQADLLKTALSDVTDKISDVKLSVEMTTDKGTQDTLNNFRDFALFAVVIVVIIVTKPKTKTERGFVYLLLFSIMASRVDLWSFLSNSSLFSWLKKPDLVVPEGYHMGDDFAVMVTSMINIYVCGSLGKDIFKPQEFLKVSTALTRATPTVSNIIRGVGLIIDYISKGLDKYLLGDKIRLYGIEFVDTFLQEHNEIVDEYEAKKLHAKQSSVDRVKKCIELGDHVFARCPGTAEYSTMKIAINKACDALKKIRTALMSTNFQYAGVRQEPVTLLMRGRPGTFKSQAMMHISYGLCSSMLTEDEYTRFCEDPMAYIYSMQAENVYMDGYTQEKKVVLIDDILQARDVAGNPDNEAMKVIRAVNVFENQLHMSDIKDKGVTAFRAPIVIANTNNLGDIELESIHDVGAFNRRWDVIVDVCPKEMYCTEESRKFPPVERKFDKAKFPLWKEGDPGFKPHLAGKTKTHPDMCEYHLMVLDVTMKKFVTGEMEKPLTYQQLVDELVLRLETKKIYHDGYLAGLDNTLKEMRERYRKEEVEKKDAEKELELQMETLWDITKDVDEIGPSVIPHSGFEGYADMMGALNETLVERRNVRVGSIHDCFDNVTGFVPVRFTDDYLDEWLERSPTLCDIYNVTPRMASWIVQLIESTRYEGEDATEDLVRFLCGMIELFLDYEIEEYSFGDDDTYFVGNYPFWRAMIRFVSNQIDRFKEDARLVSLTYFFEFSDCESDISFGPEHFASSELRFRAVEDVQFTDARPEEIVPHMMRSLMSTKPGWKSIRGLRDMHGPIAEMNNIRQQYILTLESQFIMDTLKVENPTKYDAIHYGIIKICCDSYLIRGVNLNPDDVFKVLLEAVESDLFSFYVQDGGIVDLDGFLESVKIDFDKKNSGLYKFKQDVFDTLEKIRAKTDEAGGFMYRIYKQCLAYMYAMGMTTHSALKSIQFSESMKAKAGVAFAGFAAIGVGIKVAQSVISVIFSGGSMFAHSDERAGATGRSRVARKPDWKAKFGTKESIKPESLAATNQNLQNVMTMVLNNSLFEIWVPTEKGFQKEGTHSKAGYGIVVNGTSMILPYHFYSVLGSCVASESVSKDDQVILKKLTGEPVKYVSVKEFLMGAVDWDEGEKRDVMLIRLPRHFQPCRSILKHFATEQQHDHYTKFNGVIYVPNKDTGPEKNFAVFTQHGPVEVNGVAYGDDPYSVAQCYSYEAGTSEGDCGSPAYVDDKQKPSVIIGFHVAGVSSRRKGYSTRISQEFLQAYLDLAKEDYVFEETLELDVLPVEESKATMDMLGRASAHCKVPGRQIQSAIRESPLKDKIFVSQQLPAKLGWVTIDGDKFDVMDLSQKGYSPPDVYIPEEELQEATLAISDHLEHVSTKNVDRKVMTFEVAVKGEGEGSEFKGIPRVKSAGYPYNVMPGLKSKERFFGKDMEYDLETPEALKLKEDVMGIIEKAKRGIRVTHVFTDSLKDERRPKEKVFAGKTRMFSGSPTELLILQRMYFGSFVKWLVCNRVDNNIAIGVNPYGDEWDYVARQLNKFGNVQNKGAGDFSGLDKREVSRIMWCCYDVMDMWYNDGEENRQIRKILFYEVVNSLHVNRNVFSFWRGSMSSGGFLTAPFNSLYVIFLFVISWIRIWKKRNDRVPAHKFFKYVYLIVLGDDNVYSVHPSLKDVLTEDAFGAEMLALGQVYTPEDKSSELSKVLRILEDVSFLKRKWKIHALSGKYVGPLSLDTILEMGNWIRKGANRIGDTESNIDVMLHELSLHDESTFQCWRDKIVSVLREEPEFSVPRITHYGPLFRETIQRDGNVLEFRSFASGYDILGVNTTDPRPQCGRFGRSQAGLFSPTSRMTARRPLQNPGNRSCGIGWSRPVPQMNRDATTQESIERIGATTLQRAEGTTESDVQQDITHAVSDGSVVTSTVKYVPLNQELLNNARTGALSEIRSFLAKPIFLSLGSLGTTDIQNSVKWSAAIPSDLFNPASFLMWNDKVKGHMAFRGDLHLTIQLNATRFQRGRYMLVFIPTGGATNASWWINTHTATLTHTTQCPKVEFDLNCDTEATLVIPHQNVQGWSLIKSGLGFSSVGQVRLVAYSPLSAVTGATTCTYTIYGHYENVDLGIPIIPQSGRVRTRVKRRPNWNPAEAEQESKGMGPLESIGLSISDIGRAAVGIPIISSVAGPVKWAGDLTARLASAFGWARPRDLSPPNFVNRQILHKMTNVDVADQSTKLAFMDKNELEELPGFGGLDLDEMSLNYIASIPAFFKEISWNTGVAAGTLLDTFTVSPRSFYVNTVQGAVTISHLTPLAYVSRFFAQWRGSTVFKFKLVKTEFHSGRLLVAFEPFEFGWKTTTTAPLMDPTQYLHRQIIDVRYGNEFELTVPYQAIEQYRATAGNNSVLGFVRVYVLNSLVAPSTVSSHCVILCEVSGGPDFEWSVPSGLSGSPAAQAVPQMNRGTATCDIVEGTIGGAIDAERNVASRTCVGERIVSFRQLLKRFNAQAKNWAGPLTTTTVRYLFHPFMVHINQSNNVPAIQYSDMQCDLFDDIAPMYAVYRGAMRIKLLGGTEDITWYLRSYSRPKASTTMEGDWQENFDSIPTQVLTGPYVQNRMFAVYQQKLSGGAEVEYPYYNEFPASAVADLVSVNGSTNPNIAMPGMGTAPIVFGTLERDGDGTASYLRPIPYRAIGEDASLGCFVSTIPLIGYNASFF